MKATPVIIGFILALIAAIAIWWFRDGIVRQAFAPTERQNVATPLTTLPASENTQQANPIEVIVEDLNIPWEIAFLPNGELLVTERSGQLLKLGTDRTPIPIAGVEHVGEGGLLGLALHPNFESNNFIYLYLTTEAENGLTNRVERYQLNNATLSNRMVIIENIPGARFHDGGRIAFGPDNKLYITTGDAGTEANAQNLDSLAGKILRLNEDGSTPSDNPFSTAIYSYGHRNPQGLAWDSAGRLWSTEHGRSGIASGFDEINLIEPGKNYGWPNIQGDETAPNMQSPVAHSGPNETWAPSGAAIIDNNLLFAGLRGQALYQATIDGTEIKDITAQLPDKFGRLRTVAVSPDGMLYVLTSNQDGRGEAQPGDDKIIRIDPNSLF